MPERIENIREFLENAITSKGFWISLLATIMKIVLSIRQQKFHWFIALSDFLFGTLAGYSTYEWASESASLSHFQIIVLTLLSSLNAFLIVMLITDPKIIKVLLNRYLRTNFDIKKNEKKTN